MNQLKSESRLEIAGLLTGLIGGIFITSSIWFFVLSFTKRLSPAISYLHIVVALSCLVIVGLLLEKYLDE